MEFTERLLLSLSRRPGTSDYEMGRQRWHLDTALSLLSEVFPDFLNSIAGKQILDFGCGAGYQSVALATNKAKHVVGLDTNRRSLAKARHLAEELGVDHVEFTDKLPGHLAGTFDIVISQNSMEHFDHPDEILDEMIAALNQNGRVLITFGPPWLAPYGAHTHFFTKVPWVNLLFSERTVMNVRTHFRDDGAAKYEEVEGGLNRMTVAKFEQMLSRSDVGIEYCKYDVVRGIDFLARLPLVRELFVNRISCVLSRRERRPRRDRTE